MTGGGGDYASISEHVACIVANRDLMFVQSWESGAWQCNLPANLSACLGVSPEEKTMLQRERERESHARNLQWRDL